MVRCDVVSPRGPVTRRLAGPTALALGLAALGCHGMGDPALTQLAEARRLAGELRVQLAKASDASDRAVMADTDDASIAFAREAERSTAAIDTDVQALSARVQSLGRPEEIRALQDFKERFDAYRQVDRDVLDLAVQNTNLKAQRLSFGPVREAADRFGEALQSAVEAAPAKERCRLDAVVARAELAVREIQILQAPHIAEPNEAEMTRIEKEMAGRQAVAREALKTIAAAGGVELGRRLTEAVSALDRLDKLTAELVVLSRRNSNVRSVALSLGKTPALTAACDSSLAVLEDALAKDGFSGTR